MKIPLWGPQPFCNFLHIDLGPMFLGKEPKREGSCSKNQLQANMDEFCQ